MSYQQHFLDLCAMLGQPSPAETDPSGSFYTFEKGVEKTGGGKGFALARERSRSAGRGGLCRLWMAFRHFG